MKSDPTETQKDSIAPKEAVADAVMTRALSSDEDLLLSPEVQAAVLQLKALAGEALEAERSADDHASENPDAARDATRAREAGDTAISGQAAIKSAARSGDKAAVSGVIQRTLGNARLAVANASDIVEDHEHSASSSSSERTAHGADIKAKEQSKKTNAAPVAKKKKKVAEEAAEHDEPTPKERAAAKKLAAQKRYRGENDDNDERDNEVGKGKERRQRKATSTTGRSFTRKLATVFDEDTADEIVSTAGTAYQKVTGGAAAISSGDVAGADKAAQDTGRGVRNTLRDDIGVNATVAELGGKAVHNVLWAGGRAGTAVANTGDAARDLAADKYQMMWKFGRELNQLVGGLQQNAKTRALYDTDKDGKVELHEVVNKLKSYGIHDMKNVDFNNDGNITYAEIGAAIKSRGKAPAKH